MSSRAVLKSPPVMHPPAPKRLKRSSSAASLASLPTPPRTISKRKRSQPKASSAVDSNDDSDGSVASRPGTNKKRKILETAQGDEAEEQAFWMGVSPPQHQKASQDDAVGPRSPSPTRSMSPEAAPSYRAQKKTGLVSPPPSRHQPARKVKKPATPKPSTPKRAKGKGKATQEMPIRDSPNNPFLDHAGASLASMMKTPPRRTMPPEEKSTLTYVFRGQKQEMANPLYKYKPPSTSRLPPEHPDFSPSVACPPKLLFPAAHIRRLPQRTLKRGRSPSPHSEGENEDQAPTDKISPMGRLTNTSSPGSRQERVHHNEIDSHTGRQKRLAKR